MLNIKKKKVFIFLLSTYKNPKTITCGPQQHHKLSQLFPNFFFFFRSTTIFIDIFFLKSTYVEFSIIMPLSNTVFFCWPYIFQLTHHLLLKSFSFSFIDHHKPKHGKTTNNKNHFFSTVSTKITTNKQTNNNSKQ